MKFGELRKKIFTECVILIGKETIKGVSTEDPQYDDLEVEGIRSRGSSINGYWCNSYIEVLLKK